jgi:hypothetical protein
MIEADRLYRRNVVLVRIFIFCLSTAGLTVSITQIRFLQVYLRQEIVAILL